MSQNPYKVKIENCKIVYLLWKINIGILIAEGSLSGQPLHVIGASIKTELMFNLGLSLLHARKPEEAFDCLIEAVQTYHMNPRLWLRLAECCIMTHKKVGKCI